MNYNSNQDIVNYTVEETFKLVGRIFVLFKTNKNTHIFPTLGFVVAICV